MESYCLKHSMNISQMRCNTNAIESPFGKLRLYYLPLAAQLSVLFFSLAIVTKWSISNRRAHTKGHYCHVRSGSEQVFPIGDDPLW